jgi:hypothetical protein
VVCLGQIRMLCRLLQNILARALLIIEMNGYGSPIAASGLGLGPSPAAEPAVILEASAIKLGPIDRSLPIAEMADVDGITCDAGS